MERDASSIYVHHSHSHHGLMAALGPALPAACYELAEGALEAKERLSSAPRKNRCRRPLEVACPEEARPEYRMVLRVGIPPKGEKTEIPTCISEMKSGGPRWVSCGRSIVSGPAGDVLSSPGIHFILCVSQTPRHFSRPECV